MTNETRQCKNCKESFLIEPDDFAFYEKMQVPAQGMCPECRFKWRAQFRNEMGLYSRQCPMCQKSTLSMYHPSSPYTVYCVPCWRKDIWDPYATARDYDVNRPFFDQLGELFIAQPKAALYRTTAAGPDINSEYTNVAGGNKNCYLIFNSGQNEDCMYARGLSSCRMTVDAYFGTQTENCYETVNVENSSGVVYGQNVVEGLDCMFVRDASAVSNCFASVNVRHKSNLFFNEQLSKEEYKKRMDEIRGSYSKHEEYRKKFEEFSLTQPRRENNNFKSFDAQGDYLIECKGMKNAFEVIDAENCSDVFSVRYCKDIKGAIGYTYYSELFLEVAACGYASRVIGSYAVDQSQDIEYSFGVQKSKNCFGCDGIQNAQYCILNKRYSKEEYEALRKKIIEELTSQNQYGLMLPPRLAPFAYNETIANDNMPLTREEALKQGYKWQDDPQMTIGKETTAADALPDHIRDVEDSITNEVLACISCQRNYRITKQELLFYRSMVLPIPRKCFYCRHADRLEKRGPMALYNRTCDNCKKDIKTTYAPDRPEIVYCEKCYQAEVL